MSVQIKLHKIQAGKISILVFEYILWGQNRLIHTQILVKDWLFRLGSHESEYSNMASKTVMIFLRWLVKRWIFFLQYIVNYSIVFIPDRQMPVELNRI